MLSRQHARNIWLKTAQQGWKLAAIKKIHHNKNVVVTLLLYFCCWLSSKIYYIPTASHTTSVYHETTQATLFLCCKYCNATLSITVFIHYNYFQFHYNYFIFITERFFFCKDLQFCYNKFEKLLYFMLRSLAILVLHFHMTHFLIFNFIYFMCIIL